MNFIKSEGKTVDLAIENAINELSISKEESKCFCQKHEETLLHPIDTVI